MCGRFTLFEADKILSREFGVSSIPSLSPRYNIAPSQPVAAVRAASAGTGRELAFLRWGLIPSWSKDPAIGNRLINARAETAREKPSFRKAFKRLRAIPEDPPGLVKVRDGCDAEIYPLRRGAIGTHALTCIGTLPFLPIHIDQGISPIAEAPP